jgi:hypothetical protein
MIEVVLITNVFSGARHAQRLTIDRPRAAVCDLLPDEWLKHKDHVMPVRGVQRLDWDQAVVSGDRIALVMVPRGLEAATIAMLKVALVINAIAFVVMRALMPKPPKRREDNESAVYGYQGIVPSRVEGETIPLYYGEIRVGGQIINEFVDDYGALGADYQALVSLGEGPLQEIVGQTSDSVAPITTVGANSIPFGKLFINDTDAATLDNVEAQVRMGTLTQAPVEGFEFASSTVSVDTLLSGPTSSSTNAFELPVISYSDPTKLEIGGASANSTWTQFGVSYSAGASNLAEGAVVKILLPEGASYTNDDGSQSAIQTGIAVRYIELDGTGAPITTGGPDLDGYVRLRPFRYSRRYAPGVAYDIRFSLYDPQTFTRGGLQNYASFNAGATYYTVPGSILSTACPRPYLTRTGLTVPTTGPQWTTAGTCESFTVECFFYVRALSFLVVGSTVTADTIISANAASNDWFTIDSTNSRGFSLGVTSKTYTPQPGQSVSRKVPFVTIRNASTSATFTESGADASFIAKSEPAWDTSSYMTRSSGQVEEGKYNGFYYWHHAVATYQANAQGSLGRVRLYIDGVKIIDQLTTQTCTLPTLSTTSVRINGPGGNGRISNLSIYKGVMSEGDIIYQFNNGNGRTKTYDELSPVAVYRFASTAALLTDSSGNGNTLTNNADDTVVVTSQNAISVIEASGNTGTVKKGRYKIEVLRQFKDSTSTRMADQQRWQSMRLLDFEPFQYPTAPLLAIRARATSEVNGNIPNVTSIVKGRQVPVWDGTSTAFPTFDLIYSQNPAWITCDMLLNKDWGLGNIFDNTDIDVQSFKDWADYCDEVIYNQSGYTTPYNATYLTGSAQTWGNIVYDFDTTYQTNALYFYVPKDSILSTVKVGDYLGVYGVPVVSGYADINNTSTTGGYRIIKIIEPTIAPHIIAVEYTGAAPWPLTQTLLAQGVTMAGTIQTRHPRFQFDGAFDDSVSSWDAITLVCQSASAVPIRLGKTVKVKVHKPRPVVDMVGPSQVEEGSFEIEYISPSSRFNQIEIGFIDRDLNYERSMLSAEHPSVQGTTDSGLIRRRQFFQEGVVRRAQISRQAQTLLNNEHLIRRKGKFTGSVDLIGLEPLDVIQIAHDVIDRGISGRVYSDSISAGAGITLDRVVTLAAATTYKLRLRSQDAPTGFNPDEITITSAAGTYYPGQTLAYTPNPTFTPLKGDIYTLYVDGEGMLAQVDSISLTPDLKREVTFSEYVEAVYDVEDPNETPDIGVEQLTADAPALGRQSVPELVSDVKVEEIVVRGPGGAHQPSLLVTWLFDNDSNNTAGFDVWLARMEQPAMDWEASGSADANARSFVVPMARSAVGDSYAIAVTARSESGAARTPSRAAKASVRIIGKSPPPSAPAWASAYPAVMDGEQATYRVVPASLEQGSTIEIRRGGWILGQRVGAVPIDTGKLGPTPNWASAVNTSLSAFNHLHGLGLPGAQLVVRAISNKGKYSTADVIEWAPRVIDAESVVDSGNNTYYTRSWEDFGIGWRRSGAVFPNSTLTNCQVTTSTLFPQGYLEFSGSNLTATYTTATHNIPVDQRAEWWYNSAYATVEQIWPTTWADATYGWDDVGQQWSWEGPLNTLENGDDPGRVTFIIETKAVDENGVESDWSQFTPGKVRGIYAYWRLTMTRPSTAYNIRVYHFATQLLRIPRQRFERSGLQYFAEHQIFGRT